MNYYEVEIYDSVLREYLTLYVYAIDDFQAEKRGIKPIGRNARDHKCETY